MNKKEKIYTIDFADIGLNLSASPRGLKGAQSVIALNLDYSDSSGALVGRRGTTTLAGAQPLPGKPYDIYRAYDGVSGKYTMFTYSEGGNFKIGVLEPGDTIHQTLQDPGGGDFTLTDGARVSFTTDYDPSLGKIVVTGTNGVDDPWYWDFDTSDYKVAKYRFGTSGIKLKKFMVMPAGFQGQGRRWAYGRDSEVVTIHGSDPVNHKQFVDEGDAIFFEVQQEAYSNPVRAMVPFRNQFTVFNLDSISTVYYTNNPSRLYNYAVQTYGNGAINDRCVTYWQDNLLFIDKRPPYLFLWDGARVHELDRDRMLTKGIQEWLDFSVNSLSIMRMDIADDSLFVTFTGSGKAEGSSAGKWMLVINLTRLNNRGIPYFPAVIWDLQANDLVVADHGTDFEQILFTDDNENYIRRLSTIWDPESDQFGDNNNQTGSDADPITYRLRTGWIGIGEFFQTKEFLLNADYEGTPAASDTLKIRYRFNGWTEWQDLLVGQVRKVDWIPFPKNAFGREMQFDFLWRTATARPFLYDAKVKYILRPFTRRLR